MRPCGVYEKIDETLFERTLRNRLGELYPRALPMFRNYGPALSWQVTSALALASRRGNAETVERALGDLEKFWAERLSLFAPESRQPEQELIRDFFEQLHDRLL